LAAAAAGGNGGGGASSSSGAGGNHYSGGSGGGNSYGGGGSYGGSGGRAYNSTGNGYDIPRKDCDIRGRTHPGFCFAWIARICCTQATAGSRPATPSCTSATATPPATTTSPCARSGDPSSPALTPSAPQHESGLKGYAKIGPHGQGQYNTHQGGAGGYGGGLGGDGGGYGAGRGRGSGGHQGHLTLRERGRPATDAEFHAERSGLRTAADEERMRGVQAVAAAIVAAPFDYVPPSPNHVWTSFWAQQTPEVLATTRGMQRAGELQSTQLEAEAAARHAAATEAAAAAAGGRSSAAPSAVAPPTFAAHALEQLQQATMAADEIHREVQEELQGQLRRDGSGSGAGGGASARRAAQAGPRALDHSAHAQY
jgi:hypothetical protein